MSVQIRCEGCGSVLRVDEKHFGKKARCPKCGGVVEVIAPAAGKTEKTAPAPAATKAKTVASEQTEQPKRTPAAVSGSSPAAAQPKASPKVTPQMILAGIQGEFPPKKASLMYRLGIFISAAIMILLPMIYVGLIGLVCYGVYYHAAYDVSMLKATSGSGRGAVYVLGAYLAPMIVGAILIFFMLKPLFAKSAKPVATRSLTPKSDPLLFAFVQRLCAAVRAPVPKRIDIDNQVNASASFRQGWGSVLAGNDLVLTIGAPLAAGLTVRQLAGVLAHEFGHFSQGTGMRLTFIVRSINYWFARVVYERDKWDVQLEETANSVDLRIGIFLHLARLMIWLTRRVLFVLMWIGHAASCFTLRQMEFDADQYEIWLAGSGAFEATARRLPVLGAASEGAYADLGQFYQEGRLGDNLAKLIVANVPQMPGEVRKAINTAIDESKTGPFDTHPSDADRIAAARAAAQPGIFRVEAPASVLFTDFETLCRNVTIDFYRQVFGNKADLSNIHSVDHLLAKQKKDMDARNSLQRAFRGTFSVLRPVPITPPTTACKDAKKAFAELQEIRKEITDPPAAIKKTFTEFVEADEQYMRASIVRVLLNVGVRKAIKELAETMRTSKDAFQVSSKARDTVARCTQILRDFDLKAARRLELALSILHWEGLEKRLSKTAEFRKEIERMAPVLGILEAAHAGLYDLRTQNAILSAMIGCLQNDIKTDKLFSDLDSRARHVEHDMRTMLDRVASSTYPFEHASGEVSVVKYALSEGIPSPGDIGAAIGAASELTDSLFSLYGRILARMAAIVEEVETACKLPLLPDVKIEEEKKPDTEGPA